MSTLITFLHVLVCLILVGTVLLQQGKGGGMGGAFGGANAATVFGSGGASTFLRRLTAVAATVFMLTSMVLAYIASNDAGDALKSYSAQQTQLKKRKKDAEQRALDGVAGDAGVPEAGDGTGLDDGDTGEDEGGADGIAPTPVEPAAAPGGDGVTGAEVPSVIEDEPAPAAKPATAPATTPAAPVEKPAAPVEKPAAAPATKPAAAPATKPAAAPATKPAAAPATKPAAAPATKPAVKPTDKPSTTPVEPGPTPTPAAAPTTSPTN